ncbi:MAG TPA: MFS transporter [Longimicrobiales bacterium]
MRWRALALLSTAELLAMTLWFSATAVAPALAAEWTLDAGGVAWLTMAVQLGFVCGAALSALLNLADIIPARPLFTGAALLGALANALVVLAPGAGAAIALRFATGALMAGVYPPAMKMIATWFREGRGLAIGTIVGALTIGSATPHLVRAFATVDWRPVVLASSAMAIAAAALVAVGYRDGPFAFPRARFSWALAGSVLRHRETRLATLGYLGHMWELYAGWALVAIFARDLFLGHGAEPGAAGALAGVTGFAVIAIGGLGAVLAGVWADRLGRERVTIWAMVASGAGSLALGWLLAAPLWIVLPIALVWGFAIVADSAQFSAVITEVAPQDAVGTALTLQTSLGFLLTAFTIWLATTVSDRVGWGPAFSMLALGPVFGIAAMARLKNVRFAATSDVLAAHSRPESVTTESH